MSDRHGLVRKEQDDGLQALLATSEEAGTLS